jgi:hypothetical protein
MMPDPVFDKLAKFTPDAAAVNPAELLFAAGRASARTPWGWKTAVAGLILTNLVCVSLLVFHSPEAPPEVHTVPAVVTQPEPPSTVPVAPQTDDPWTYHTLISVSDPERFPKIDIGADPMPTERPLTPLSWRRGGID